MNGSVLGLKLRRFCDGTRFLYVFHLAARTARLVRRRASASRRRCAPGPRAAETAVTPRADRRRGVGDPASRTCLGESAVGG